MSTDPRVRRSLARLLALTLAPGALAIDVLLGPERVRHGVPIEDPRGDVSAPRVVAVAADCHRGPVRPEALHEAVRRAAAVLRPR